MFSWVCLRGHFSDARFCPTVARSLQKNCFFMGIPFDLLVLYYNFTFLKRGMLYIGKFIFCCFMTFFNWKVVRLMRGSVCMYLFLFCFIYYCYFTLAYFSVVCTLLNPTYFSAKQPKLRNGSKLLPVCWPVAIYFFLSFWRQIQAQKEKLFWPFLDVNWNGNSFIPFFSVHSQLGRYLQRLIFVLFNLLDLAGGAFSSYQSLTSKDRFKNVEVAQPRNTTSGGAAVGSLLPLEWKRKVSRKD